MCKLLLFAGTTEGRLLYERLSARGIEMDISVATEYGKELVEPLGGRIYAGRMSEEEMESAIRAGGYKAVIDATHPYADIVTKNIQRACRETETLYIRLLRKESRSFGHLVSCQNIGEAVEYLQSHSGNVLSTIGSKQVSELKALPGYQDRVFARVLPLPEAINACLAAGFSAKNIICMQGPFSQELNTAMLRQYDCRYLLTKNSGDAGGFEEKLRAAEEAGATVLVIERPIEEEGLSLEELRDYVEDNKLHICHWFTVDDLNHLKRGGRVSAAAALVGTMLQMKPVLHVDDEGRLIPVSKVRGRKDSLKALVDKMEELVVDPSVVFISHGDCGDEARELGETIKAKFPVEKLIINYVGPVIGNHSGPGTMALFFQGKHR